MCRRLLRGPLPVGRFAGVLGVTRQAARKVVSGLEERGLVTTVPDASDSRRLTVALSGSGERYARVVVEVIGELNRQLAEQVNPDDLAAALAVLDVVIAGGAPATGGEGRCGP